MVKSIKFIVVGGLNTDITALGVKKIAGPGEHTYAKELKIGPGGKSRNIAQMIANLTEDGVAMIGKTVQDKYGFWKLPINALAKSGVNTDFVQITPGGTDKLPGVALIAVDEEGTNQIYVAPGVTNEFSTEDIDKSRPLFEEAKKNSGILVTTLEYPKTTCVHAVKLARYHNLQVVLDPGGISDGENYDELFSQKIFLIKPNEHEAKILTGVEVKDFFSARKSAKVLLDKGVENILITAGRDGGYFFCVNEEAEIPVPDIKLDGAKDETGCGDQTTAAFSCSVSAGKNVLDAAKVAILAGALQFNKEGIDPVTAKELKSASQN